MLVIYSIGNRICLTCSIPCSPAYSVDIACYILWAISLHHPVNRGEIQTTSSNICCKQYAASLSLQCNTYAVKAVVMTIMTRRMVVATDVVMLTFSLSNA